MKYGSRFELDSIYIIHYVSIGVVVLVLKVQCKCMLSAICGIINFNKTAASYQCIQLLYTIIVTRFLVIAGTPILFVLLSYHSFVNTDKCS